MKRWLLTVNYRDDRTLSFYAPRQTDEQEFANVRDAIKVGVEFARMEGFTVDLQDRVTNKKYEVWGSGVPQLNITLGA